MKLKPKLLLIFILVVGCSTMLTAQRDTLLIKSVDSLKFNIDKLNESAINKSYYQEQIKELNSQILILTSTVASTKESFYNSSIYLWTFIITALGLIIVVVGIFGYKSISDKIAELKTTNDISISKSEVFVKEIKDDLIQRISDIKSDIKEFKNDQIRLFEKFEKESKDKIEKGLSLDLQNAIDKIMKESFSSDLSELSEQVADLTTKFDNLSSKEEYTKTPVQNENKFNGETSETAVIKPTNNAFDE